jgi:RNA polymerase sigma factor (sigma-70 family)
MGTTARVIPSGGWAHFFDANADALLRAASGILHRDVVDASDVDDVVMTVMRRLIAQGGAPADRDPVAYALTAVRNEALDRRKRQRRSTDQPTDFDAMIGTADVEAAVDDAILVAQVLDALDDLPDNERTAIRGKFLEERPWADVAAEIGITTLRGFTKAVNRGLDRLRAMPQFAELFGRAPRPSTTTEDTTP